MWICEDMALVPHAGKLRHGHLGVTRDLRSSCMFAEERCWQQGETSSKLLHGDHFPAMRRGSVAAERRWETCGAMLQVPTAGADRPSQDRT